MNRNILQYGEQVIKDGIASQIEIGGVAAKSGNLILTDSRILLVPHKVKRNSSCLEIPLNRVLKSDDKFQVFCDTPNVIEITTIDNNRFRFSIKKGQKTSWEQSIHTAVVQYYENHPFTITEPEPTTEPEEAAQAQEPEETPKPDKEQNDEPQNDETPKDEEPPHSYVSPMPKLPPVNNILIWLVVIAPIVSLFFEFGFWLFLLIAIGFCYWDESNLRRLGYDTAPLGYAFLIPAYLYKRSKLTGTSKSYLVFWCLTFLIGILCTFITLPMLIGFLEKINEVIHMEDTVKEIR